MSRGPRAEVVHDRTELRAGGTVIAALHVEQRTPELLIEVLAMNQHLRNHIYGRKVPNAQHVRLVLDEAQLLSQATGVYSLRHGVKARSPRAHRTLHVTLSKPVGTGRELNFGASQLVLTRLEALESEARFLKNAFEQLADEGVAPNAVDPAAQSTQVVPNPGPPPAIEIDDDLLYVRRDVGSAREKLHDVADISRKRAVMQLARHTLQD
mmetsp:Transcript_79259/g.220338  ORF Transcript_79259/g.220338 Transcript_79259/m.220338 type:complete len:210 (-) Transcript_79259:1441-2070(-)